MIDNRLKKMAKTIVDYSLNIQKGEKVVIDSTKNCTEMIIYLIELISKKGAIPLVMLKENDIKRKLVICGSKEQFEIMRKYESAMLDEADVYINMMDSDNCFDMSDVPQDKRNLYQKYYFKPINFEIIMPKLRWITVDYPSVSSAQQFGMSTEAYEKYFFGAVNVNYQKLHDAMIPLKNILDNGNNVHIVSPNIDLSFSIANFKSEICSGKINIPDGEIFIAPVLNSGNKYIGEFAIGTNPNITDPKSNILFDEKILGSFHIALGNSHALSDNGNRASIHWDMVNMLTKKYGGGKIIIDDQLIQQDGIFIPPELQDLNKSKVLRRERK